MSKVTPCEACGRGCMFEDPDPHTDEPCYGEVRPITRKEYEGDGYVGELYEHACEGHQYDGRYIPES
jgi:hypothetical protein